MFKIKKLTKYAIFALAITFIIFIALPNSAKANGDDDGYYYGSGWEDDVYFDDTSYYPENNSYYPENNSYYPENNSYYPEDNYYYPEDNYYYPEDTYYSSPSYYQSDYSYGLGGCSTCSYGGYSYTPAPQIVYIPNPTPPYVPPVTPPQPPALNATCVISPSNVNINDSVTFSANATGGTGSYTYYWSGSDGISGNAQVITGRFTSVGSKTATVTVTSGNQTVTRTCNAYVNQNQNYNYNYNYGYNYNNNYGYNYNYTNLTAICSAQPSSANVGDNVIWTVYPNGGNGSYTYSWTGTDGLSYGNAYQIQQRYTTPGTKSATVTVYSTNGQSIVATCNANIVGSVIAGTPISGIYLNEVPATGIDFNIKVGLYMLGLILWSAFVGFMIVEKRKAKLALANRGRIEDFKQENLRKKGLL
jgi:hypothetical protein